MSDFASKGIPLIQVPAPLPVRPLAAEMLAKALRDASVLDTRQRALHDLRISVTDRCNFRCTYCMPKDVFGPSYAFLPHDALLSFEEITRFTKIAAQLGVSKLRLTGGEPTLRRGLPDLIAMLAALRTPSGQPLDLTLTTNGSTLAKQAQSLRDAGLQRITISLDSLDDKVFRAMNNVDFPVSRVLSGIEVALVAGLTPIKINMVVQRGVNDNTVVNMARHFKGSDVIVRFIEYMDVGNTNGWQMHDVVPSAEIVSRIHAMSPLTPIDAAYEGEVATRWRYVDGSGEIGVISSVTRAFCQSCTRARLSTDGKLFTCLFATQGLNLRPLLRGGANDETIAAMLAALWQGRSDRYSELRSTASSAIHAQQKVEMSYIGG